MTDVLSILTPTGRELQVHQMEDGSYQVKLMPSGPYFYLSPDNIDDLVAFCSNFVAQCP